METLLTAVKIPKKQTYSFQSIIDFQTGTAYGVEVVYSEDQLPPFSPHSILLESVDRWEHVVHKFLKKRSQLNLKLFLPLDDPVLSATDEAINYFLQSLSHLHLSPSSICFLLKPGIYLNQVLGSVVKQYRSYGFQIVLDQFDMDHLSLLYHLEPDILSLSPQVARDYHQGGYKKKFISYFLKGIRAIGCKMMANHVDSLKEYQLYSDMGCDFMKGRFEATQLQTLFPEELPESPLRQAIDPIPPAFDHDHIVDIFDRFRSQNMCVPVVNTNYHPVGIIRERDIKEYAFSQFGRDLLKNKSSKKSLKHFIQKVPFAKEYASLETILELFAKHDDVEAIPIVDEKNHYLGILEIRALLKLLNLEISSAANNPKNPALQSPLIYEYISKIWELKTAAIIQNSLIPKNYPDVKNIEFHSYYQPAAEIGGDWFGFMTKFPDTLVLLIGDVTGHGTPSAMVSATASATSKMLENVFSQFRTLTPSQILYYLNMTINETGAEKFWMTFFVGSIDLKTGVLTYSNAGHNFPLLIHANGEVTKLRAKGTPLGLSREVSHKEKQIALNKGDTLILYTDGLIENEEKHGKAWGESRLVRTLKKSHSHSKKGLLKQLIRKIEHSFKKEALEDDVTVVECFIKDHFHSPKK